MKENFFYHELLNSFIGQIDFFNDSIEFEIKLKESELNWIDIEKFILGLNDNYLPKIIETSSKLLLEFIRLVPFGVKEPFNDYEFKLEAMTYYGKVNNHIFSESVDSFELVFKLYHSEFVECYDPYGNYIVNVENRLIVGVRREQI